MAGDEALVAFLVLAMVLGSVLAVMRRSVPRPVRRGQSGGAVPDAEIVRLGSSAGAVLPEMPRALDLEPPPDPFAADAEMVPGVCSNLHTRGFTPLAKMGYMAPRFVNMSDDVPRGCGGGSGSCLTGIHTRRRRALRDATFRTPNGDFTTL